MEFTIRQSALKDELGFVAGIVERKSTIPVLSNILIESIGERQIRIVGTDLDVTIRCEVEADIKKAGAMCVQARRLFDIVRLLEGGDVHFRKEDNEWVTLKAGRSSFRLAGVARDQFPEVPSFKSVPMSLPGDVFAHFISNTAFAITNEQSRFTLSGAKFVVTPDAARMVTTDGHRLAFIEKKLSGMGEGTMDALVPKKALLELTKIARESSGGDVSFGEDQNHIYFEVEGRLLITRKLTGNFPNYEMVMPKDNDHIATFDLDEMRAAVRRISLMADERTRSIRVTVREGELEVMAQSSEEGSGNEFVQADYQGEEITLGFNAQYLQEFLNVVGAFAAEAAESAAAANSATRSAEASSADDDASADGQTTETDGNTVRVKESASRPRVSFEFKDANAQTLMRIAGDTAYDYKYIVMPLRI